MSSKTKPDFTEPVNNPAVDIPEKPKRGEKRKRSEQLASWIPWPVRSGYEVGKTRRQRQAQYKQQINTLLAVLAVTLVLGFIFILSNWNNAGATKPISCAAYPEYCVPLAGGSTGFPSLEASGSRTFDMKSAAAAGVERYIDANNVATLGNPKAPIHFVVVSDFACPHCQDYHKTDMPRFINDYVLTGKATFGIVMVTGTGQGYSELASEAALCAGEQGSFWEMAEEFFRQAESRGIDQAFTIDAIRSTAKAMGLDSTKLTNCLTSNRYGNVMQNYATFTSDHGVSGTPTILVSYGNDNNWNTVSRDYASLKQLTEATNKPQ